MQDGLRLMTDTEIIVYLKERNDKLIEENQNLKKEIAELKYLGDEVYKKIIKENEMIKTKMDELKDIVRAV